LITIKLDEARRIAASITKLLRLASENRTRPLNQGVIECPLGAGVAFTRKVLIGRLSPVPRCPRRRKTTEATNEPFKRVLCLGLVFIEARRIAANAAKLPDRP
jgi:hypothetical protein